MVASPNNGTVVNTGYTTNSPRLDYDVNFAPDRHVSRVGFAAGIPAIRLETTTPFTSG